MDEKTTKAKLLAELDQEWAHIERLCAGLTESKMITPVVSKGYPGSLICLGEISARPPGLRDDRSASAVSRDDFMG
jgi:hypothetical protein